MPEDWRQVGYRTDWVALWGQNGVTFGLTTDETLWTWGLDLGKEPVKTFQTRLELLRRRLTGGRGSISGTAHPPYSAEPRPVLKLIPSPPGPRPNQGR